MTPAGIEPATFRSVAQHLNHCATAVPHIIAGSHRIYDDNNWKCHVTFTVHINYQFSWKSTAVFRRWTQTGPAEFFVSLCALRFTTHKNRYLFKTKSRYNTAGVYTENLHPYRVLETWEKALVSKIEDLRGVKSSAEEKQQKSNQWNREKCEYALCNRFTCSASQWFYL